MSSNDRQSRPPKDPRTDPSGWEEDLGDEDLEAETSKPEAVLPRPRQRPAATTILHYDDELIVVAKPAGTWLEPSEEDQPNVREQLQAAGAIRSDAPAWQFVYPLDVAASG